MTDKYNIDVSGLMSAFNHRKARNKQTLEYIAKQTGVSSSTLSRLSQGILNPTIKLSIFLAICNWLNVDPSFFLINSVGYNLKDNLPDGIKDRRIEG